MTEPSYTAWDDKQYVWPPPDGWYKAADNKWWPEGYGPPEVETSPAATAPDAGATVQFGSENGATAAERADETIAIPADGHGFGEPAGSTGGTAGEAAAAAFDRFDVPTEGSSGVGGLGLGDAAAPGGESASDSDSSFGTESSFGPDSSPGRDSILGGGDPTTDSPAVAISDVDGLPTSDIDAAAPDGDIPAPGLGDFRGSGRTGTSAPGLGDFRAPETDTVPFSAPGLGDLTPPGSQSFDEVIPGAAERVGLDDATSEISADMRAAAERLADPDATIIPGADSSPDGLSPGDVGRAGVGGAIQGDSDIPSIRDLASPDLDLTDISISEPEGGPAADVDSAATQVVPDDVGGQFAPPPPGGPTEMLPPPTGPADLLPPPHGQPGALPPPDGLADLLPPEADVGTLPPPGQLPPPGELPPPGMPGPDPSRPQIDAPSAEHQATDRHGPAPDPQAFDSRAFSGPEGGPGMAPPPGEGQPPGYAQAPPPGGQSFAAPGDLPQERDAGFAQPGGVGFQSEQLLDPNRQQGGSRKMLAIIAGVVLLALIGGLVWWFFVRNGGSSEVAATGPGSFGEPHPRATGVVVFYPDGDIDQRWIVEILEPVRDATEDIVGGGSNPPEEGEIFAAARVRVRNESGRDGAPLSALKFNAVSATGDVIVREDNQCSFSLEDLDYGAAITRGSQIEGDVCWSIPADQITGLLLGLESQEVPGRVHIQMQ